MKMLKMPIGKKNPIAYKIKTVSNKSKKLIWIWHQEVELISFEPIKYYYIPAL
jgi:hypothetical protein